ncbi:MAG: hypothetical protein ACYCXF_04620 [Thermoleophilia bacterium]
MSRKRKIGDLFSAVAFAEAGEFDTGREIVREDEPTGGNKPLVSRLVLTRPTQVTTCSTKA